MRREELIYVDGGSKDHVDCERESPLLDVVKMCVYNVWGLIVDGFFLYFFVEMGETKLGILIIEGCMND